MLSVGVINYINFLPIFAALKQGIIDAQVDWLPAVPSALNQALREGKLDVSPISAAEYLANRSQYDLLPDFCIGAEEKVMSVCLYVKGDIQDLDGKTIGLTAQSASSALLVKVLCHHFWNLSPSYQTMKCPNEMHQYDAFLLIGDDCLRNPKVPGYTTIDLATAWHKETGLPFTFAVFAARKEVTQNKADEVQALIKALHKSYAWGKNNPHVVEELALQQLSLPLDILQEYYQVLRFVFDERQKQGLQRFSELVDALPQPKQAPKAHACV
ncbi:MAG: menaquinone biosynthesis protein [Chlamydiales bacterium]|nr:menaquinone biosynthesis protein [Chlamydiales bacterium]